MYKFGSFLVALIILSILLVTASAEVVFQDNFGNGDLNKWAVVGSPNIVTTPVASGYAYSVQIPLSTSPSYINASFPSIGSETLEFYFMSDTVLSTPNTEINFATIVNGLTFFTLGLSCDANGNLDWVLGYPQTIYSPGTSFQVIPSAIQANTWYKFELAIENNGGNGAFALSINDSPIYSLSSVKFNWNPTYFILGLLAGATGYNSGNMYIDGVTVTNTAKIQQSTSTTSPTISPTPISATLPTPIPSQTSISTPAIPEFPALAIPLILTLMTAIGLLVCFKKHSAERA